MFQSTKDALGRSQKHKKEFNPSDTPSVSEGLNLYIYMGYVICTYSCQTVMLCLLRSCGAACLQSGLSSRNW